MEWNGVRFRVWAPDVERAVVAYENKYDPDSTAKPLEYRDGLWQGFVDFNEGIKAGTATSSYSGRTASGSGDRSSCS